MSDELQWTKDVPRTLLKVTVMCLIVSVASVLCAYYLAPGDAWTFEFREWHHRPVPTWLVSHSIFGPTIVYIELSHSVVIAALSMFILGYAYQADFVRTAHLLFLEEYSTRKYVLLRAIIAACALAVIFILVKHHLLVGPSELRKLYEQEHGNVINAERVFVTYHLPYLLYFPYSFVNFFCGMTPVLAVCLLSVFRDVRAATSDLARVLDKKGQDSIPEKVLATFAYFYEESVSRCGRYSSLALGLGGFAVFEKYFGVYSTTAPAESMASLGIQVVGIYGLSIVVVLGVYLTAFERAHKRLQQMRAGAKEFADKNNLGAFLKDLWNRYMRLHIGIVVLCNVIFPWVPNVVNYFKPK